MILRTPVFEARPPGRRPGEAEASSHQNAGLA
jgi:hypothetical protein